MNIPQELTPLINTIKHNCDIADADGAAIFSICGMALRLRDLNKWEKGLSPWQEDDPAALLGWIDQKEQTWEKLSGSPFTPLLLDGKTLDPFDTGRVNEILGPMGFFYGAGYAHSLKPTFILARIRDSFTRDGIPVLVLGEEQVRDLLTIPALNQDGTVILREDAARLFLWDQMAYLKASGQRFLKFALRQCGLEDTGNEARKTNFDAILAVQMETYLCHEIGEMKEELFDRQVFREIVSSFPHSPVELLARTLRDLLADTGAHGPMARMISQRDAAALGFYAAFQEGLFRPLFPQLRQAVEKFVARGDWEDIDRARQEGLKTAEDQALALMEMYREAKEENTLEQAAEAINEKLVRPLLD